MSLATLITGDLACAHLHQSQDLRERIWQARRRPATRPVSLSWLSIHPQSPFGHQPTAAHLGHAQEASWQTKKEGRPSGIWSTNAEASWPETWSIHAKPRSEAAFLSARASLLRKAGAPRPCSTTGASTQDHCCQQAHRGQGERPTYHHQALERSAALHALAGEVVGQASAA